MLSRIYVILIFTLISYNVDSIDSIFEILIPITMNKQSSPILFTTFALALLSTNVYAASDSWDGSSTNALWSESTNWLLDGLVPGTGDTATFNAAAGAGGSVIDLEGAVTLNTLAFDTASADSYTIGVSGADTLTLDDGGSITVGADVVSDQTVDADVVLGSDGSESTYTLSNDSTAGNSLTLAGSITGGSGGDSSGAKVLEVSGSSAINLSGVISDGGASSLALISSSTGTLTLSAANTYTGGTTIGADSTVQVDDSEALGTGSVTLSDTGATLSLGEGVVVDNSLIFDDNGAAKTITVSGTSAEYSGDIDIAETSSTIYLLVSSGQTLELSGDISSSGGGGSTLTLDSAGTVIFSGENNTFSNNFNITANARNAVLRFESDLTTDGTITMRTTSTVELADGVTLGYNIGTTTKNGVKKLALDDGASATMTGNINNVETSGFQLTAGVDSTLTITGNLTGSQWFNVNGSGTVILAGANTQAGNITFTGDGGTLTFAEGGSVTFYIEDSGVNNAITVTTDSGTLNLEGEFIFDLTSASTTIGDSWIVVDGTFSEEASENSVTLAYGSTFAVSSTNGSFSDLGDDVWSIFENGVTYEFSELTGELTVVPEPSTYAFLAGLLGLSVVMLRRRKS
jgi:autotransporter-associated beta strand protein